MATAAASNNVDYRLLNRMSNLVICSSCLQRGKVTPVAQVISNRHALTNECVDCRAKKADRATQRASFGKLLTLPV